MCWLLIIIIIIMIIIINNNSKRYYNNSFTHNNRIDFPFNCNNRIFTLKDVQCVSQSGFSKYNILFVPKMLLNNKNNQRKFPMLLDLTTVHLFPSNFISEAFLISSLVLCDGMAVFSDVLLAGTVHPARKLGFLWVFMSSVTFFRPPVTSVPLLISENNLAWLSAELVALITYGIEIYGRYLHEEHTEGFGAIGGGGGATGIQHVCGAGALPVHTKPVV